jgi:acetate kinase
VRVLALNPGSSSLRFKLLGIDAARGGASPECFASGSIAAIGPDAHAKAGRGDERHEVAGVRAGDPRQAVDWALGWLAEQGFSTGVDAVGVRVVHAGVQEDAATPVTPELEAVIERLGALDPLHNAASLAAIRAARRGLAPEVPLVAVFDTAFHAAMPEVARWYALPLDLQERHGIRRFGFHGLAIASVLERHAAERGSREPERDERVVVLHLGSGASVTAVRGGRCVDTTMGFSPLEGLVMSTRSGDLDPALVAYLARVEDTSAEQIVRWLHERAGLLGVSGRTGDMRELERLRAAGDRRAALAFDLFVHRAKKGLAAMIATLGGVDAVLFSGGVGENSAAVRAAICARMEWCGLAVDARRNAEPGRSDGHDGPRGSGGRISPDDAGVLVRVVSADEEQLIARETAALLAKAGTR